jgi:hypothetical protein
MTSTTLVKSKLNNVNPLGFVPDLSMRCVGDNSLKLNLFKQALTSSCLAQQEGTATNKSASL